MIRMDSTEHSTVVRCDRCPGWFWAGLGAERDKGRRVAAAHEASCHPDHTEARRSYANAYAYSQETLSREVSSAGSTVDI
jgi:hypothetical protein